VILEVALAVNLVAFALASLTWYRSTHGIITTRRRRRVLVTLKSGESFAGVLLEVDHQALVLRQAEALGVGENRTNVAVDGEVVILRPDVAFIQLP
jgi:small nuclear ribonucleoprotein (snRNP)-like protein